MYIKDYKQIEEGAIATRFNADGSVAKVDNGGIEVDAKYKLDETENGWEWILIK